LRLVASTEADRLVDALAVEAGGLDREMPELFAGIAEDACGVQEIVDDGSGASR
jgi:hypothetical protein